MKYLVVGLGNIGDEYAHTRHNIGFDVLDALASASNIYFQENRYGKTAEYKFKGRTFILLKPSTFMNLSGKAVNYWLQKENIPQENLLVIVDDLALPIGKMRLRGKGSDGGHNGLKNINEMLGNDNYARLRFGIGDNFAKGRQIDFVLSRWTKEEESILNERILLAIDIIRSFGTIGVAQTMNLYNNK
ncbi:MAG TPA: aminoacyl-tRNA hydrolase [Bacteroidales bacterium]|nr:aminoacyl-tRNA hydrolase [Bacteroidales bacterium]